MCPFLHFDNSRSRTYEHYVSIGSWNVKSVLDFLEVDPTHRFCLDQVTLLEGFKKLFPNYWDTLHQRVLEGRVEIVGGTYVMPDFVLPDGESIVRQYLYGTQFFRKEFGIDVRTGWAIDSAGHPSQMPQILRLCGMDSYYFWRGMGYDSPSEFIWKAPDGSQVIATWLSQGYDCAAWLSENQRDAFTKILKIIEAISSHAVSNNLLIPTGGELVPPLPHLADIASKWNSTFPDMRMAIVTPREFTDKTKTVQARMPVIEGGLYSDRFASMHQGGLSARTKLKILNRRLESLVHLIELYMSFGDEREKIPQLENLWRILLFNQDHNIIRGTLADEPFKQAIKRYQQAVAQAEQLLEETVARMVSQVARPSENLSFVVTNPLPWSRDDFVQIEVDLTNHISGAFELRGPDGRSIPFQVLKKSEDSTLVNLAFVASGMPPLSHRVYSLVPVEKAPEFASSIRTGRNWIESSNFILEFDEFSGAIFRFFDKASQNELLRERGNYITIETDVGDLYEFSPSNRSLQDSQVTSLRTVSKIQIVETGPVRATAEISGDFDGCTRRQRISVYEGVRRVDFETELEFKGQERRVRLSFPLNVYTNSVVVGSQFAAEERLVIPRSGSSQAGNKGGLFHALDWVDCAGPDLGICFSAIGLHDYEFTDGVLSATLLRSVNYLSRGKDDEIIETETAREIGSHSFRYSIIPHRGKWDKAKVWRSSAEHRLPLMACCQESTGGSLPLEASFLEIQGMDLALSCLKPTGNPGEFVLRLYEMGGNEGIATLKFFYELESVNLTDLCERDMGEIGFHSNTFRLPVGPHSILTLRVKTKRP